MHEMRLTFDAVAHKQGTGPQVPWVVTFVSRVDELEPWVGIPRRSDKGLVGFQRLDNQEKVERAKEFFSNPMNQSPTALVLGIHNVSEPSRRVVTLEFDDPYDKGDIRKCRLHVDFDGSKMSDEELCSRIREQIDWRLKDQETEVFATNSDNNNDESDEDEDEDEDEFNSDSEDDQEGKDVELGRSLLSDLLEKLDDPIWVGTYRTDLVDFAKPATLIDGQHRMKGAELCERGIPFTVCALFDCSWFEQVFQFTIINYTQTGIPDQFITANAALSLTKNELKNLGSRLSQAKVKVVEYELMKVVNFDQDSPFFDLVDLSEKKRSDRIGYKTMVKVAKSWWKGSHPGVLPIIQNLYPNVKGTATEVRRQRLKRWQDDDWGVFFIAFWGAIYKIYANKPSYKPEATLWNVGESNLMIAVVLLKLQDAILDNLSAQDREVFEGKTKEQLISKVEERVDRVAEFFPAKFFGCEWKTKSLNTGAGKIALEHVFNEMIKKKGKFGYETSTLVTGTTR
jgi:hypothetical protein